MSKNKISKSFDCIVLLICSGILCAIWNIQFTAADERLSFLEYTQSTSTLMFVLSILLVTLTIKTIGCWIYRFLTNAE